MKQETPQATAGIPALQGGEEVNGGQERAARMTGAAWGAVALAGGPHAAAFRYLPGAFTRAWLAGLPLPAAGNLGPGQVAATLDSAGRPSDRHHDSAALKAAYEHRPTTRVYEDIGWGHDGIRWAALAGQHLTRLAGGPRVTVAVYESAHGDQELGTHRDTWLGVIVQAGGAKTWRAGEGLVSFRDAGVQEVTLTAGDVLVVPKNLPHEVTTPAGPGWSVHLAFAVGRDLTGP